MCLVYFLLIIFFSNSANSIGGLNELKSLTGNRLYMGYGNPTYAERMANIPYYTERSSMYNNDVPYRMEMAQEYQNKVYLPNSMAYQQVSNRMGYMDGNPYESIPLFGSLNSINNLYGNRYYRNLRN
uniref:Uncharacterized protein n=1 Tax=Parastrongyloides trichosuri TaxID=131310 RepID=A0A0N5A3T4_PARTI